MFLFLPFLAAGSLLIKGGVVGLGEPPSKKVYSRPNI